jgi:hypothetical protein
MEQKATRAEIYAAIDGEREYQEGWKDPTLTDTQGIHSVQEFLSYIQDYTAEAIHVGCRRPDKVSVEFGLHNLRKIAALAVSCMEQHGVRERDPADSLKQRHQ